MIFPCMQGKMPAGQPNENGPVQSGPFFLHETRLTLPP